MPEAIKQEVAGHAVRPQERIVKVQPAKDRQSAGVVTHQRATVVLIIWLEIDEEGDQEVSGRNPGPDPEIAGRGRDQSRSVDDVGDDGQEPTRDGEANCRFRRRPPRTFRGAEAD
jgi:hypothetical protein